MESCDFQLSNRKYTNPLDFTAHQCQYTYHKTNSTLRIKAGVRKSL